MANLTNIYQLLEKLNENDRSAIIALIDLKVESDMQQVLNKLDVMAHNIDAKFSAIDARFDAFEKSVNARFDAVDARFDAFEKSVNARFDAVDARFGALESAITSIRWWNATAIAFVGLVFVFLRFFPG